MGAVSVKKDLRASICWILLLGLDIFTFTILPTATLSRTTSFSVNLVAVKLQILVWLITLRRTTQMTKPYLYDPLRGLTAGRRFEIPGHLLLLGPGDDPG